METGGDWLLWDGDCGLCALAAAYVRRRDTDGRLRVVPWQQAPSPPMTAPLAAACRRAVHVVTAQGQVLRGEGAVLHVLAALGYRRWARVLAAAPGRWLLALGYRWVARHRAWLSRLLKRRGRGAPACPKSM